MQPAQHIQIGKEVKTTQLTGHRISTLPQGVPAYILSGVRLGRKNIPHANTYPNHGRFDPSDGGAGHLLRTSTAKIETLAGGALGRFL